LTPRTRLLLPLLLLAAAVAVAGCGQKEDPVAAEGDPERIDLVLDYVPNPDHVGIYAAKARGEFQRAGLDVRIRVPSDPAAPLKLLAAGDADLVISYQPELLLARDRGLEAVSVGALVQRPLTSIISLDREEVRRPADLAGKRVGTAGIPYQEAYLRAILEEAGEDPRSAQAINVGFQLTPALVSGRVDATLGAFWNVEGVQLRRQDRRPVVIPVDEAGVPTYNELIVVARREALPETGQKVRAFMQALARGHEAARDDPRRAVDALVEANPDLDRRFQLASVRETLPVFFPEDEERPFGWHDPRAWHRYGQWMHRNGLVREPPHAERALTNEFLAGEGL
jgi:putative hydroxymethylpyrimidine transport system substrate-binding protein